MTGTLFSTYESLAACWCGEQFRYKVHLKQFVLVEIKSPLSSSYDFEVPKDAKSADMIWKMESFCNLGRLHVLELVLREKWRKIHRGADDRLAQKLKPARSLAFTTLFVEKKGRNHLTTMALQELHNWKSQNCRVRWCHVLICRNKLK